MPEAAYPVKTDKPQFFLVDEKHKAMKNFDTIFLKRFTAKEEPRRLCPSLNIADDREIAIENHVNYLSYEKMDRDLFIGIYNLLASDTWDTYYRIVNGSTQVNAEELNLMPIPELEEIRNGICF